MAIYGMDYFPLFAALALESAVGYCVGTAYAWLLFIVQVFQIFECPMEAVSWFKNHTAEIIHRLIMYYIRP